MRQSVLLLLAAFGGTAHADGGQWFDASRGCGRGADFLKSGKMADLPGCSGRLPGKAPPVEVTLHDAKRTLLDIEHDVERGKVAKLDAMLQQARTTLQQPQTMNPDVPGRWDESRPFYEQAMVSLRNRGQLLARLEKLRDSYHAALDAERPATGRGKPASSDEGMRLAQACLAEFSQATAAGIDPTTPAELEKGRSRSLAEWRGQCESVRDRAATAQAAARVAKAQRVAWRRPLRGDRLRIFDAHPDALPTFAGKKPSPKAAVAANEWRYATAAGDEVFLFKHNKLLSQKSLAHR